MHNTHVNDMWKEYQKIVYLRSIGYITSWLYHSLAELEITSLQKIMLRRCFWNYHVTLIFMYGNARKERREKESVEGERLTRPGMLFNCWMAGMEEVVRNKNRIKKIKWNLDTKMYKMIFFPLVERWIIKKLRCCVSNSTIVECSISVPE